MFLRTIVTSCLLLAATAPCVGGPEYAHGIVRSESIWSPTLGVRKNMLVYLPPSYDTAQAATKRYPVAMYLHGRWGDETDWVMKGNLARTMDSLAAAGRVDMIVVMPDGDDGWWTTWASTPDTAACRQTRHLEERPETFCVPQPRYDAYAANDVLRHVDSTYRTLTTRESRGIGGLSMGGYGAIAIAARYPEVFGVAVSHGGVLSPGYMPDSSAVRTTGRVTWRAGRTMRELRAAAGENQWSVMYPMFGFDSTTWEPRDPAHLLVQVKESGRPVPMLYTDAALADGLLQQNRIFRQTMAAHHIAVEYAEWPGEHTWQYWQQHLPEGLVFMAAHLSRATLAVATPPTGVVPAH
jgi:S-formylglutathione hydrolase FrmB